MITGAGEAVAVVGEASTTGTRASGATGGTVSLAVGVTTLDSVFSELVDMVAFSLKKVVQ